MKDTKPRVATCNRCSAVVLAAMSGGMRAAVDPTPLNFDQMREVLVAGGQVYRMYMQAGRPTKLGYVTVAMLKLPAAPYGTYAAAHGCGCHAMDATAFEEHVDPSQAPAVVPDGLRGLAPVPAVTRPRSRARCRKCGGLMEGGEYVAIETPFWYDEFETKTYGRGKGRTYTKIIPGGWGTDTWAIHSDGCQTRTVNTNGKTT